MSQSEQNADETQLETLTEETQYVETRDLEPGNLQEDGVVAPQQKRKKPEKKEVLVREPGKTLFPMSRVQKIIKADKVNYCKGCNFLDINSDRGNDKAAV